MNSDLLISIQRCILVRGTIYGWELSLAKLGTEWAGVTNTRLNFPAVSGFSCTREVVKAARGVEQGCHVRNRFGRYMGIADCLHILSSGGDPRPGK